MSQRPSMEKLKKIAGQPEQLNSKLQAVLGNLDAQLDDELARYRRKKRVEAQDPQPSPHRSPHPATRKNLELVVTPTPLTKPFKGDRRDSEAIGSEVMAQEASATPKSRLSPFSPQVALPQRLEASLSSSQQSSSQQSSPSQSDDLSSTVEIAENHPESETEQPNDYLESSEKLLDSLDDSSINNLPNQSRRRRRRRSFKSMLSPLTVGVTLLFVLAVGTLAHVFSGKEGDRQPVTTAEDSSSSSTETPLPKVPKSPNLADKEFVPLDLDTIGTLPGNNSTLLPMPTVPNSPPPAAIENSVTTSAAPSQNYPSLENISTAILPQSIQDNQQNSSPTDSNNSDTGDNSAKTSTAATSQKPPAIPEKPAETVAQPTVNAQSFPAFFYVLIEYQNDDNLFLARQVVPDAYVREFPVGVKIQMGAFEDAPSAQIMVKYLKEQGLAAQVYQP